MITQTGFLWLGTIALLITIGSFLDFGDEEMPIILTLLAAVLWAMFFLISGDVKVYSSGIEYARDMAELGWVGFGMAALLTLFFFKRLYDYVYTTTTADEISV